MMTERNQSQETSRSVTQQQVAEDFDRLTESYERDINSAISFSGMEHTFFIDVKRERLVRLAADHFGDVGKLDVLDLGCGLGAYHPGLKGVFRSLHGVDVSARSVEMAAQAHPHVEYRSFDGVTLPYEDASFDMAFAICVMHHVPPVQWEGFVAEMRRILRPGGQALIFEHNPYNPATQYIVRTCEIDKDAVLLTPGRLRKLFSGAGFRSVYTRTILSIPPKGTLLQKLDSAAGYLPFGAQYYLSAIKKPA